MYSLTKNLFQLSVFVKDLEQTSFFLKSDLSINNFAVLLHLKYLVKSNGNGSRTSAPEENCPQTLILTLNLNQTLTLTMGQLSSGGIVGTPVEIYVLDVPHFIKRQKVFLVFTKRIVYHFYTSAPFNVDWLANFWRWATLIGSFEFNIT